MAVIFGRTCNVEAILADLDGDGFGEIIIHTEDGYVRVLKENSPDRS